MDCMVDEAAREVTFLYKFTRGVATDSYGLHCAQAAGLPGAVVERAAERKQDLESSGGGLKVVRSGPRQRHKLHVPACVFPCCRTLLSHACKYVAGPCVVLAQAMKRLALFKSVLRLSDLNLPKLDPAQLSALRDDVRRALAD